MGGRAKWKLAGRINIYAAARFHEAPHFCTLYVQGHGGWEAAPNSVGLLAGATAKSND